MNVKRRIGISFIFFIFLAVFAVSCSCGDDDDDDDSSPVADDTTPDDDTGTTDDTNDDTTDDTTDDTVDDDDTDTEYASILCALPDPMSLGGNLVGGGAPTTQIDVYVYDDGTCAAIEGASVLHGGTVYTTDVDGHAVVTLSKSAQNVTAWAANSWAWSYKADASVMYFRLRPDEYNRTYNDSGGGDFVQGGTALGLTNPSLVGLFTQPVYAGIALPGISRKDILSLDEFGIMASGTFALTIDTGDGPSDTDLPANIYLPTLNLEIPTIFEVTGGNTQYAVPLLSGADASPIEGLVAGVSVGEAIPGLTDLLSLITCITGGGDIIACVLPLVVPIVNDALAIDYMGADPAWDGTGAPDLEVLSPANSLPLTVSNASDDFDYVTMLAADIPNRALVPMSLGFAEDGAAALDYVEIPDADYGVVVIATDLIASDFTSANLSFAMKYAETLSGWTSGVTVDAAADFLPAFDEGDTGYNDTTGLISWGLMEGSTLAPDLYMIAYIPACEGCKVLFAQVPGSDTSYQVPITEMEITPSAEDIVLVLGLSMPADVDIDAYNPVGIAGYNVAAVNLWTNFDILSLISDL